MLIRSVRGVSLVVLASLSIVAAAPRTRAQAAQAPHTDFSGTWVYDESKNTLTGRGGGPVSARMLGDRVTIVQDAETITMTITNGAQLVTARYKLDGSDSRNVSPGAGGQDDVVVMSRASWDGAKLVIDSTSTSVLRGQPVPVLTKRVLAIDGDGLLTMDRSGTPAGVVIPTRSVYRKSGS